MTEQQLELAIASLPLLFFAVRSSLIAGRQMH